ncbi:sensor histidine kinase [Pedomonas mirosovicensis]|uniref:sensor histidine kinase n=1 Tax=Pedomonas mirosovicensis TaxID=2908641 RepID=UPI00216871F9|nr:PAS domain-containing sensor histidine kinase [Pedomonas mirosovicensis]MCH8685476.1 ATP-binding protein [Pedomonas mirosovicensis]
MGRIDSGSNETGPVLVLPPLRSARRTPEQQGDQKNEATSATVHSLENEANTLLFKADRNGRVVDCNEAFRQLNLACGGSEAEVGIPSFQTGIDAALLWGRQVNRSLSVTVGGVVRHYWANFTPMRGDGGRVVGVTGTLQEATAQVNRTQSAIMDQARFRDFARASSDWFWEIDELQRLTALSDRLTALIGSPVAMLIGKPLQSLGRFEANMAGDMPFERAVATHAPFRNQLMVMEDAAGDAILFHLAGVPVFDDAGAFRGYRGVGMDVTRTYLMEEQTRSAHRNLEDALAELTKKNTALDVASEQARLALEAKNEFLASMSHELRTPLNAIIGFAEAMQMQVFGDLQPHYVAYANDIVTAGYHLLGLINDVLDVSVIESGELTLTLEGMSLAPLVDQARSLLLLRAEAKSIDLSAVRCDPSVRVMADERRALQILVNLLTNAVKFTPEGGRIGLDVAHMPGATPMVAFTVWDTGTGIAPENHERVFEKFQQCVGDTYTGKPEGTGLGLHISRRLARLMGGDISLDSKVGLGARFTVLLPAA